MAVGGLHGGGCGRVLSRHWAQPCRRVIGRTPSLAEFQEEEEEDPEDAHGVPVPDGGVDEDLAGGERAGELQGGERGDEGGDAEERDGRRG